MTTLLTPAKLALLKKLVGEMPSARPGVMAEVGVYRGGSAKAILEATPDSYRALYLFDTFSGLPEPGRADGALRAGQFAARLPEVMGRLEPWAHRLYYHVGVFPGSAAGLEHLRFRFVHVDVDLYQSTWDCCGWFTGRMVPGGIMLFDDYGCRLTPGARRAVDEYYPANAVEKTPEGPAVVRF